MQPMTLAAIPLANLIDTLKKEPRTPWQSPLVLIIYGFIDEFRGNSGWIAFENTTTALSEIAVTNRKTELVQVS